MMLVKACVYLVIVVAVPLALIVIASKIMDG